jgi:hypothetical protein
MKEYKEKGRKREQTGEKRKQKGANDTVGTKKGEKETSTFRDRRLPVLAVLVDQRLLSSIQV